MRRLYVSYDRAYHYLGTGALPPPGDYNTRVLLLVNGVRTHAVATTSTTRPILAPTSR